MYNTLLDAVLRSSTKKGCGAAGPGEGQSVQVKLGKNAEGGVQITDLTTEERGWWEDPARLAAPSPATHVILIR